MQKSAPMSRPPRQQENQGNAASPALLMANRIRSEQGTERAREYLYAMEPFLAPGERLHIAKSLGIPAPQSPQPQYTPPSQGVNNSGGMGGFSMPGGMSNLGGIMQLMQLMGGMQGGGNGGQNPLQLMQMLSGLMGGKK